MNKKISFIGVGNMATAIIKGITSRACDPILFSDIVLYDTDTDKIKKYSDDGAYIAKDLCEAVSVSDYVVLCVKPQSFSDILPTFSLINCVENKLFITIAAGIPTNIISKATNGAPIVRVMPNTPMLIGQGVSAICKTDNVSKEDFDFACKIFASAGNIVIINEDQMNRIICVTGSSPAYVFMMIKAMFDGASAQGLLKTDDTPEGLTEKELLDSICDTIIGSAMLMKSGHKTPKEQIQTVCSKGGTTEQAVTELERYKFYEAYSSAMLKCTNRAEELGQLYKSK